MVQDKESDPRPIKSMPGLGGWGRFPVSDTQAVRPEKYRDLSPVGRSSIARGQGRSYGDAALTSSGTLVLTEKLGRFLAFDIEAGILRAEAGATLKDILDVFVPKGWFLPVTPGTQFCSLGGCVAADVHGKNHHRDGTFSRHVLELEVVLADDSRVRCSAEINPELFWATVGGMGLTGIISEVVIALIPIETASMKVRHIKTRNLDQTVELLSDPTRDAKYTVAWLDVLATGSRLGRGIFMSGEHALKSDISLRIKDPLVKRPRKAKPFPIELPGWVLNPMTVKAFNGVYDFVQGQKKEFVCGYEEFFYPLDGINGWNKMYGKRGFVQYQYVLPTETAAIGTRKILEALSKERKASFLAVLKRFGAEGQGLLSFPKPGLTLALDIPMSAGLLPFLDHLDKIVLEHGGRLYLAKDSRMSAEMFRAGYPRLDEFCQVKNQLDPTNRLTSDMAKRLKICP